MASHSSLSPAQVQILELISANPRMRSILVAQTIADLVLDLIALLIVDLADGTILFSTRRAEEMFGYFVKGELAGQSIDVLVPEEVRPRHAELRAQFAAKPESRQMGSREVELSGLRSDGTVFPVEIALSAARFPELGDRKCVIAEVIDMTRRRKERQPRENRVQAAAR